MELSTKTKNGGPLSSFWSDMFNSERFFDSRWPFADQALSVPPANVIENGDSFKIELSAPGFAKDNFKVDVDGNVLSISAQKEEEENEKTERYTRKEFRHSSFSRSFTLPQNCDDAQIDARYTDGILSLVIPKKETGNGRPKKAIPVK